MKIFCKKRVLAQLLVPVMFATWAIIARADDATSTVAAPAKPGRMTVTIRAQNYDRVVQIQVPASYKPEAKPPLVVVLHGAGGSGAGMLDRDGWAAAADKQGFIAVAPDGLPAIPKSPPNFLKNPPLWNSGQLKTIAPRAAIDDVAFIRQLLDELKTKIPYDESRAFCVGHSNGGSMTFRLGAELSERFAGIGAMAGLAVGDNLTPKKPLPTMCILGTKDPLMPIDGGEVKLPWGTKRNPPVAEPLAKWAKAIGCETEPATVSDQDGVKKVEYPSAQSHGPTLLVLYLDGHGHQWPGAEPTTLPASMIGPVTSKLDAASTFWDFFKSCGSDGAKPAK